MLPAVPDGKTYPGKIILVEEGVYVNVKDMYKKPFYYDPSTGETTAMTPEKILDIAVSPDKTRYALVDAIDRGIKIYSEKRQLLGVLNQGKYPYFIDRWLDNDRIIFVIQQQIEGTDYLKYPRDEVALDIFTGKQQMLPSDYPDIDIVNARVTWEGISTTKYDSSLTRVVYPASIASDYQGNSGSGYVLWDVVHKVKLAQIVMANFLATPVWSPDESKFVINDASGDGEFYITTRDGAISKISHLNDILKDGSLNERNFSDKYSWSPEGRYLAFWHESIRNRTMEATLAVLDTDTGNETNYCISAGDIGLYLLPHYYKPIWSPDGKSVVIVSNRNKAGGFDTVLVDLEGGFAIKIADNLTPAGWLDGLIK